MAIFALNKATPKAFVKRVYRAIQSHCLLYSLKSILGSSEDNIPMKILSQTAKKGMTKLLRRYSKAKKMKTTYFMILPVDIRIICPNLQD